MCKLVHYWGGEGLNIPEGDQIFKTMSEILGPMGPNISTTIEIFGPGGQNITGDQISCDTPTTSTPSMRRLFTMNH